MDTNQIADMIYSETKEAVQAIAKAQGLKGFGLVIPMILTRVEEARGSVAALTGEEKKDVAVKVLNRFINIPVLPEFIEAKLIAMAIDWFVAFFNRSFGNKWLSVIQGVDFKTV